MHFKITCLFRWKFLHWHHSSYIQVLSLCRVLENGLHKCGTKLTSSQHSRNMEGGQLSQGSNKWLMNFCFFLFSTVHTFFFLSIFMHEISKCCFIRYSSKEILYHHFLSFKYTTPKTYMRILTYNKLRKLLRIWTCNETFWYMSITFHE